MRSEAGNNPLFHFQTSNFIYPDPIYGLADFLMKADITDFKSFSGIQWICELVRFIHIQRQWNGIAMIYVLDKTHFFAPVILKGIAEYSFPYACFQKVSYEIPNLDFLFFRIWPAFYRIADRCWQCRSQKCGYNNSIQQWQRSS